MLQQILVTVIVMAAAAVSAWKLMPARRRLRLLLALDAWVQKRPGLARWRERSLRPRIARAGGVGCDGCGEQHLPRSPR
jgi:hypothetical protein